MTTSPPNRVKAAIKIAIQAVLVVGVLGFLLWWNSDDLVALHKQPKRWGFLGAGFFLCLAGTLLTFLRWFLLMRAQELPLRLSDTLRIGFIGYLFNQLIPGAVSGDMVKVFLLFREQERRTVAISTVVIDRVVGMYGLTLVAGLASLWLWSDPAAPVELRRLAQWVGVVVGVGTVAFVLLFGPLVYRGRWIDGFARLPGGGVWRELFGAMRVYKDKPGAVAVAVAMSVACHVAFVSTLYCAVAALQNPPWPAGTHFVLAPIGLSINAIPITPGGIGLGEGGMQTLFELAGHSGAVAFAMMLCLRVTWWLIALAGVPYLVNSFTETRRAMREAQPAGAPSVEPASATD